MMMFIRAIVLAMAFLGSASETQMYALTTVVVDVDYETDTVEVVDGNGNLWAFYGTEDWQVGDTCSLLMDDSGTEIIFDDEVLKATYSNFEIEN